MIVSSSFAKRSIVIRNLCEARAVSALALVAVVGAEAHCTRAQTAATTDGSAALTLAATHGPVARGRNAESMDGGFSLAQLLGSEANDNASNERSAPRGGLLGACIARASATMTAELAQALGSLGYTQFAEDACRLSLSASQRDPLSCDQIAFRSLAEQCRLRVAVARGERELCPHATDEPGPDPLCVALATRVYSACPGAGITAQHHCRAIAEGDRDRCRLLPGPYRMPCEQNVDALLTAIPHRATPQPAAGAAHIRLEWVGPSATGHAVDELDVSGMDRGAFATESRGVVLVDPRQRWPHAARALYDGERVALGAAITVGEQRNGLLRELRLVLRDGLQCETLPTLARAPVRFTRATLQVGHELEGELDTTVVCGSRTARLSLRFSTFIRDTVTERVAREGAPRAPLTRADGGEVALSP